MSSKYGPMGPENRDKAVDARVPRRAMECQLFESLVLHLIEKGVLTRNDALSVVQTVAEVKRGEQEEGRYPAAVTQRELGALERLYSSFELLEDRTHSESLDSENIIQLRPPLHGDEPNFPSDDG